VNRHRYRRAVVVELLENRRLLAADFTLVAVSDTQYTVESFPATFAMQTQWAADHADDPAYNVAFLAHQGDMLRRGYSGVQADVARDALSRMDGIIPYSVVIGNHDFDNQFDDLDHHISSAHFTSRFGDEMYAANAVSGFGGSSLDQRNHYQLITAGDREYMVLGIEWEATDASIAWAQRVIDANPNTPVILSTHEYLNGGGRTTSPLDPAGNSGQGIFTKLVSPNPQIFLVLGGHTGAVRHQTSLNAAGLPVFETVSDFEGRPNGGDGWMQLFHFYPDQNKISVSSYSPKLDRFDTSSSTYAYDLSLDFATRFNFSNTPIAPPTGANAAPVGGDDGATTTVEKSVTIDVLSNDADADGDAVKPILSSLPAHGAVFANAGGTFTYTPDPKFVGVDTFSYVVSDGKTKGNQVVVSVNVAPAQAAYDYPVAESTSAGTRTGNYTALAASDGIEEVFKGSTVTQRWQFNVTGGTEVTFAVNARRDWNTNEYKLQYSTNASTWFDMAQLVPSSSRSVTRTAFDAGQPYQMWRLPATTKGTLYVRPLSTENQGGGWTMRVDEMFVMNTAVVQPPPAPTWLTGSYKKNTRKATLNWRDNASNESGYHVWYSTDGGATYSLYSTLSANTTGYTTGALTRGRTYLFKVSAFNAAGDSLFSNTVSILAT
jgi:hypothetical protein